MLRERWWHRPLPLGHPHDLGGSTPTLSECSPTISQTARQPSTHQPSWRPISRSRRRFSLNEASSRIRAKRCERAWECWLGCWLGAALGHERGSLAHERGFLDLVDGPLLVAVLDPAGAAAGADGDRVQTEGDGDQGRSAQRAAWHDNLSDLSDLSDCLLVAVSWRHGRAPGARLESVLKAASVAGSSTADPVEVAGWAGLVGACVGLVPAACSRARNAPSSWMVLISGAGNTTVVFWSTPISTRLWRLRSCKANGWAIMTSEAAPSWSAASCSPSAAMILARFSRSASAWRAMARFMVSGSWMSFSSTRVTTTPQASVVPSRISRMATLMRSVSARVWSRVCWPTTLRRVVWAIWLMAAATFSIATTALVASTTR